MKLKKINFATVKRSFLAHSINETENGKRRRMVKIKRQAHFSTDLCFVNQIDTIMRCEF